MPTPLRAVRVADQTWSAALAVALDNGTNLSEVINSALRAYAAAEGQPLQWEPPARPAGGDLVEVAAEKLRIGDLVSYADGMRVVKETSWRRPRQAFYSGAPRPAAVGTLGEVCTLPAAGTAFDPDRSPVDCDVPSGRKYLVQRPGR